MGIITLPKEKLIIQPEVRTWCVRPYYNHPKGCPNYGKRKTCPPQAQAFENYIDIDQQMLLVVVGFDLKGHIELMRAKHPDWSEHQLRCVLYWQGKVRAELKRDTQMTLRLYPGLISTDCPEAMGVNVIETARYWYRDIKMIPEDVAYKIAICGYPKEVE